MVVMTWKYDMFRSGQHGGYLVDSGFFMQWYTDVMIQPFMSIVCTSGKSLCNGLSVRLHRSH